jgi:oligosaccharide amylase
VGNGRILGTIGASGEIMGLFWPRLDYAQNVRQAMPALYLGHPQQGRFVWTWQPEMRRKQYYLGATNVLVTQLHLDEPGVEILITDGCPPGETVLVRRVRIENRSGRDVVGSFMHYFEFWLGEAEWKQAVRYEQEHACVLQYFRDYAAAVGGTAPDIWRCGKWTRTDEGSAKVDMYDGHLNGQPEDIGQVNFALGWHLQLPRDGSRDITIIVALDHSRELAVARLERLREHGAKELHRLAHEDDGKWLRRAKPVKAGARMEDAYRRALLSLRMLVDHHTRAVIAAPEFDPGYEMCGGYGYCWPRDAAEAVLALEAAGYGEHMRGLARWLVDAQLPKGVWGQRYWCDGAVASSWALRDDFLQLDESASAMVALCAASRSPAEKAGSEFSASLWPAIRMGALALLARLDANECHTVACDLWETYAGVFAYTQAGVVAALRDAAEAARAHGDVDFAETLATRAENARGALLGFYQNGYFVRGLMHGRVDPTVDSSALGLIEPFGVLDLENAEERAMAVSTVKTIDQRLGADVEGGRALRRYEGDSYLGGAFGAVNTLWMALVCYRLAATADENGEARQWTSKAEAYIGAALTHATPSGLLPELIPQVAGVPYWAAPHAWASALMVRCAIAAASAAP